MIWLKVKNNMIKSYPKSKVSNKPFKKIINQYSQLIKTGIKLKKMSDNISLKLSLFLK